MGVKLISHVNGDGDLIEAWLKYYLRLGVDRFHLIVHGSPEQNERLLEIKVSYPISIEDMYEGPFESDQKKKRLDAVLARNPDQWVVLVDSDEFVEFPYGDILETVRILSHAKANVMAAPMLQRLTKDGSLETPSFIDDPFQVLPLCSATLYRKMGIKADIFKFPLFFCAHGTCVMEEGNHHPPLGSEPRSVGILGVTHHFKFRRTVSGRLQNMILSEHPWRHESVQFREYLDTHSNRLPLDDSFVYSREELFRRRLLRRLPLQESGSQKLAMHADGGPERITEFSEECASHSANGGESYVSSVSTGRRIMFVLPKTTGFGRLERGLFTVLRGLNGSIQSSLIACLDGEAISEVMDGDLRTKTAVKSVAEPKSLANWIRFIRRSRPDIIVFCYSSLNAFRWQGPFAALLGGVRRRVSIQYLIALPASPSAEGNSLADRLRRLISRRARHMFKVGFTRRVFHKTICVADAVRNSLVRDYQFPIQKTITIHQGVSTSAFAPCKHTGDVVRDRFDVDAEDFLLVCVARLIDANGVDIVLNAVSRAVRQGVRCKCIVVGDGPLRGELQKQANSLGMTGYLFFEGFQRDVRPYLQAASALILTCHIAGLPLSILEAMACGVPCIVTDVGGIVEAVKDRVNGLVVSPGSLDETESAILYLATHPRECAEMARKARETVCQGFNADKQMGEMANAILN